MHLLPIFFLLPLLFPSSLVSAQDDSLECPDSTLQSYLIALIDALYANGLTIYEDLLATIAQTDSGYDLLQSWYSDNQLTLLVPTDSAFQMAGIWQPFQAQGEDYLVDLVALHTLSGDWEYDKQPNAPLHGTASSLLGMASYANSTTNSTAYQVVVMQEGDGGSVVIKTIYGNATSWSSPIDLSGTELTNLVILPIDTIIGFPVPLSTALTVPTTTRSTNGLTKLAAAFDTVSTNGAAALEGITEGGFTIFAPVDDAWTEAALAQVNDSSLAATLLGNHYTTSYSLYSPAWYDSGTFSDFTVVSGESLTITYNGTGNYVTMGDQTAMILRSDITLENGVMHIIDTVFLASSDSSASPTTRSTLSAATSTSSTSSNVSTSTGSSTGVSEAESSSSAAGRRAGIHGLWLAVACVFAICLF